MQMFNELGEVIEARWRDHNYNESAFPRLAAEALAGANLTGSVDPWEIVRWVHSTPNLPEQMDVDAAFGNPPITLFVGPRFYIDAYYWLDGTTNIHQHAFSGAFQVLQGSSVHSRYTFVQEQEINPHFLIGKIDLADVTLLKTGDIREINPGREFIHSLFHLERPSVTITVRTHKAPAAGVQYTYFKPSIALNLFFKNPSLMKKAQTVALLLGMKHRQVDNFIGDLIDSSDFHTTYAVLKKAFDVLCHRQMEELFGSARSLERFERLVDRARRKHGEIADVLLPVFEEEWRQTEIAKRRAEIKQEDHRFLLALLMNVPNRMAIQRLVEQKFPDRDAVQLIIEWIRELSRTRIFGSKEPNVLGASEFGDLDLLVLKQLLDGLAPEEINHRLAADAAKSIGGAAAARDNGIQQSIAQLQNQPLLKPLLV